jgi:hypothetical protein
MVLFGTRIDVVPSGGVERPRRNVRFVRLLVASAFLEALIATVTAESGRSPPSS